MRRRRKSALTLPSPASGRGEKLHSAGTIVRPTTESHAHGALENRIPLRSRRHARRQRLPARARMAGSARKRGHSAFRLAYPSQDRHERRAHDEHSAARKRPRNRRRTRRAFASNARGVVQPPIESDPSSAGRESARRASDRSANSVGDRDERPHGNRASRARKRSASTSTACRSSRATKCAMRSRIPISSSRPRKNSASRSRHRRSWATASGTCSRRHAHARSASACSRGGYATEELERAGAYRVFDDPADMLRHIDEIGGRR